MDLKITSFIFIPFPAKQYATNVSTDFCTLVKLMNDIKNQQLYFHNYQVLLFPTTLLFSRNLAKPVFRTALVLICCIIPFFS